MNKNINEIIERDWGEDEMDAVALAGGGFVETALPSGGRAGSMTQPTETTVDHLLAVVWNSVVAVLILGLVVALCLAFCKCRELKATERARAAAACPSGTAQRVVDEVNREPFVRVCNRLADAVFCARNSLAGKGERDEH